MAPHIQTLPDFGFSLEQIELIRPRLDVPQFVYVSGPAGGGKTRAALLLAWTFFQNRGRPFRTDGQDMTLDQIRQAAREHNTGILFHDMAASQDYYKAGFCLDCRMVALGIAFDGPAKAVHAHVYLLSYLPGLSVRHDVVVIGVERDEDDPEGGRHKIDLFTH
ncbi:hypothetical protein [uncultured Ferrovibrio sp.]|jgi:hypothetical protein|uniref:hypothetical protein n=1 Tax=uncultured Ferrovibrio sp. TaxID=1576913 RepID=UPI00262661B9|nr:hypothetical protein [uncultured Ferrovibrio sp.]